MKSKIIKKNNEISCNITKSNSDFFINGIIYKVKLKKDLVYIFLSYENFIAGDYKIKDHVRIKFLQNNIEHIYNGIIVQRYNNFFRKGIIIKTNDIKKYENYRLHERFRVKINLLINMDDEEKPAKSIDLSLGGLNLITKMNIKENDEIGLNLKDIYEGLINLNGKVIRKQISGNLYKYGVQITKIDEENNKKYSHLIEYISLEYDKTFKELRIHQIKRLIFLFAGIIIAFILMMEKL